MIDLISRQAAIEWCLEGLNNMPPAQQEIIRCKDCKYNDLEEQNSTTRWLPCIDAAWPDDWFCGCAERRKDE